MIENELPLFPGVVTFLKAELETLFTRVGSPWRVPRNRLRA